MMRITRSKILLVVALTTSMVMLLHFVYSLRFPMTTEPLRTDLGFDSRDWITEWDGSRPLEDLRSAHAVLFFSGGCLAHAPFYDLFERTAQRLVTANGTEPVAAVQPNAYAGLQEVLGAADDTFAHSLSRPLAFVHVPVARHPDVAALFEIQATPTWVLALNGTFFSYAGPAHDVALFDWVNRSWLVQDGFRRLSLRPSRLQALQIRAHFALACLPERIWSALGLRARGPALSPA